MVKLYILKFEGKKKKKIRIEEILRGLAYFYIKILISYALKLFDDVKHPTLKLLAHTKVHELLEETSKKLFTRYTFISSLFWGI